MRVTDTLFLKIDRSASVRDPDPVIIDEAMDPDNSFFCIYSSAKF